MLAKKLGRQIATLRKRAGLTQEQLAEAAGYSVEFISLIERGGNSPTVAGIEPISSILGVEAKELCSSGVLLPSGFDVVSQFSLSIGRYSLLYKCLRKSVSCCTKASSFERARAASCSFSFAFSSFTRPHNSVASAGRTRSAGGFAYLCRLHNSSLL